MNRRILMAAVTTLVACGPMTSSMDGGSAGGAAGGRAGGSAAGGSAAGGSAAGGSAAGGSAAGGSAAGGSAAGGSAAGGSAAGGSAAGGSAAGGSAAGGSAAGGSAAGGSAAGGSAAGGSAAGGSAAGGSAAGGSAAGGSAAGGSAAGGSAAGGSAAGGSAAGGSAAGGSAAGGSATGLCTIGAYDAGRPGGDLTADGGFEALGLLIGSDAGVVASATSTYSGYPASWVLDLDVDSSWYIDSTCVSSASLYCCEAESIRLDLPTTRSVSAVVLRGNQGLYANGFDFLTARLDFLNASGGLLSSRNVVFNRPAGDWAIDLNPPIANVRTVRLVPGWAENSAPGIAEILLYGP